MRSSIKANSYPENTSSIRRWMYGESMVRFLQQDVYSILGELAQRSNGNIETTQRNAWQEQIHLLKGLMVPDDQLGAAHIYFELTVPRLGRRADVVLIIGHVMFILEFKVGESEFNRSGIDQVWDYALDFKYFHDTSHDICIVPVLIATQAPDQSLQIVDTVHNDKLAHPIKAAPAQLSNVLREGLAHFVAPAIDVAVWEQGRYMPTPSIVEAARALYAGHAVENISRSDAGAHNLSVTAKAIDSIIEKSRSLHRKAICFVTGVPGAGKTLVGLDIATRHLSSESDTYSVFLSGNGPLVAIALT